MSNTFEITLGFVEDILTKHDPHCVFELDAPRRIHDRLMAAGFRTARDIFFAADRLPEFRQCFVLSEIYCPHEGIDRRAEYSMIG